jgi:hypothetical protein
MGGNFTPRTTLEYLQSRSNQLLTAIELALGGGGSPVARVPSIVKFTSASGSTTTGVKAVSLFVESDDATIGGVAVPDGYIANFSAEGSHTVDSIAFNAGTGSITITYLT